MLIVEGHDTQKLVAQPGAHHREIAQALAGRGRHQAFDPDRDLVLLSRRWQSNGDAEGVFLQIGLGRILDRDHARAHAFGQGFGTHQQT